MILQVNQSEANFYTSIIIDHFWFGLKKKVARHSGSHLQSQHFGRLKQANQEVKRLRQSWPTWWNPVSTKNTKISWVWWYVPVVPATREAEAGELLEPRRQRLQWTEITSLHSSLAIEQEFISKKERETSLCLLYGKCLIVNSCQVGLSLEELNGTMNVYQVPAPNHHLINDCYCSLLLTCPISLL